MPLHHMWGSRFFDINIELTFSEDLQFSTTNQARGATGAVECLLRGDVLRPEELHGGDDGARSDMQAA